MADLPKRVAIVYDHVNKWGGAERVLLALHKIFPNAPLYTSVYSPDTAQWAKAFPQVITSFINRIPFVSTRHEIIPFLTPIAVESFDFSNYEMVISVTSFESKGIVTPPGVFHLCYCLTPTRFLWSHLDIYRSSLGALISWLSSPIFSYLKNWDLLAARRPDAYISISKTVQKRLKKYYLQDSEVVYPPVSQPKASAQMPALPFKKYYLYVGRLVAYKRPDIVIAAFNKLKSENLIVVGTGSLFDELRSKAGSNIHFAGFVPDSLLAAFYRNASAVIFYHEEDFGIVPIESQSLGVPVIALDKGGAGETVLHGKTGVLSKDPSVSGLIAAINMFRQMTFNRYQLQKNASRFSRERFMEKFVKVASTKWRQYHNIHTS